MYDDTQAIAICLNCPVTSGCVHDLGSDYYYLCPLESTKPLGQQLYRRQLPRKNGIIGRPAPDYRASQLEQINRILDEEEAPAISEISRRLGLSAKTVRKWIAEGHLADMYVRRKNVIGRLTTMRLIIGVNGVNGGGI